MLCYSQTTYTTLIYIPFFIFPHICHFFVHVTPSVLEVSKFPCGRTPFHPSEDTDGLLSELHPLSHYVATQLILHKSEKMGVEGCQIRTIGGVWKNFPPHFCNCFRREASRVGASVVMQYDDVSSRTFIAQCTTELLHAWA